MKENIGRVLLGLLLTFCLVTVVGIPLYITLSGLFCRKSLIEAKRWTSCL